MPNDITREVTGTISDDGKILEGNDFSVSHLYAGVYVVKFKHPFFYQAPDITITVSGLTQGAKAKVIDKNLNSFKYFTIEEEPDSMHLQNFEVNFSAVGMDKPSF